MKSLNEISKEAFENSKKHGFWEKERDFGREFKHGKKC